MEKSFTYEVASALFQTGTHSCNGAGLHGAGRMGNQRAELVVERGVMDSSLNQQASLLVGKSLEIQAVLNPLTYYQRVKTSRMSMFSQFFDLTVESRCTL